MSFQINFTPEFRKDVKRLAKKYRSLPDDINQVVRHLTETPQLGDSLGHNCYKIRLAIASKGQGKSGGGRLITYVQVSGETVTLLALYDKSELSTLTDKQVTDLLSQLDGAT